MLAVGHVEFLSCLSEKIMKSKLNQMFPLYKFIMELSTTLTKKDKLFYYMASLSPIIIQKDHTGKYKCVSLQSHDCHYSIENSVWWYWQCLNKFLNYIFYAKREISCPFIEICQQMEDCAADQVCKEMPYQKKECDACLFWKFSIVFHLEGKMKLRD